MEGSPHTKSSRVGPDIVERTFGFALRAVRLYQHLHKKEKGYRPTGEKAAHVISNQFLRSATSVGSNVEEAQAAESRADFIHKLRIAQKESRESRYWIRLLRESGLIDGEQSDEIFRESDEILKILSKIIATTKANTKAVDRKRAATDTIQPPPS